MNVRARRRSRRPRRVMMDFGGWNVAKPMHIGHLRATIIGDSLQRLFRFRGDDVTSDVHLGDWGLQMGLLIVGVSEEQPDLPYFVEGAQGPFPEESPVSMEDLERLYPQYADMMKEFGKDPASGEKVSNPNYRPEMRDRARTADCGIAGGSSGISRAVAAFLRGNARGGWSVNAPRLGLRSISGRVRAMRSRSFRRSSRT